MGNIAYKDQPTIAIITARGGSKRLPGKNLQILNAMPLLWYPIRDAHKSRYINRVYVSTENRQIAKIAEQYGATVIPRPQELATDTSTSDAVLEHAINTLRFHGNVVLLQPTAPLRTSADVDKCIESFFSCEPSIIVTIGPMGSYTGSVYIFNTADYINAGYSWKALLSRNPYIHMMPRRHEVTNINSNKDLLLAEKLFDCSDDEFDPDNFSDHAVKEKKYADKIASLHIYLRRPNNLEKLRDHNRQLYLKLRDNPERVSLLAAQHVGGTCLDVGCSGGLISLEIAQKQGTVLTGIDIRPEAIEEADHLSKLYPENIQRRVHFRVGTIDDVIAERSIFDSVMLTEVLEHIDFRNHDVTMKALLHAMHEQSNLILSVPNRFPAKRYVTEGRDRWNAPAHRAHFSRMSLKHFLSQYFRSISFFTMPTDSRPEDGIWLFCDCRQPVL